jgi:hypothetical protein
MSLKKQTPENGLARLTEAGKVQAIARAASR